MELNPTLIAPGTQEKLAEVTEGIIKGSLPIFQGEYTGVNPDDESDVIDLRNGYTECATSSKRPDPCALSGFKKGPHCRYGNAVLAYAAPVLAGCRVRLLFLEEGVVGGGVGAEFRPVNTVKAAVNIGQGSGSVAEDNPGGVV